MLLLLILMRAGVRGSEPCMAKVLTLCSLGAAYRASLVDLLL